MGQLACLLAVFALCEAQRATERSPFIYLSDLLLRWGCMLVTKQWTVVPVVISLTDH